MYTCDKIKNMKKTFIPYILLSFLLTGCVSIDMTEFTSYPDVTPTEDGGSQSSDSEEHHDEDPSGDEGGGENPSSGEDEDEETIDFEITEEVWNDLILNKGIVKGGYNFGMTFYLDEYEDSYPLSDIFDYKKVFYYDYYYEIFDDHVNKYEQIDESYSITSLAFDEYLSGFDFFLPDVEFEHAEFIDNERYVVQDYVTPKGYTVMYYSVTFNDGLIHQINYALKDEDNIYTGGIRFRNYNEVTVELPEI